MVNSDDVNLRQHLKLSDMPGKRSKVQFVRNPKTLLPWAIFIHTNPHISIQTTEHMFLSWSSQPARTLANEALHK
jgi:hypothetical protein